MQWVLVIAWAFSWIIRFLIGQVEPGGVDDLRLRGLDDPPGLADPVLLRLLLGGLGIDGLVGVHDAVVGDRHQLGAELLLDVLGRAGAGRAVRSADAEDPRVLHPGGDAQQADHPVELGPVAGGQEDDLLALLVPLGEVHPAVAAEGLREEGGGQAHVDQLARARGRRRRGGTGG